WTTSPLSRSGPTARPTAPLVAPTARGVGATVASGEVQPDESTCRDRTIVVPITGRGNSRRAGAEELAPEGGSEGRSPQPRKQRMPSWATSTDPTHRRHRLRIAIRQRHIRGRGWPSQAVTPGATSG